MKELFYTLLCIFALLMFFDAIGGGVYISRIRNNLSPPACACEPVECGSESL